jgi:hypothetical protein
MLFEQFLNDGNVLRDGLTLKVRQGHLRTVQPRQQLLQELVATAIIRQAVGKALVPLSP